MATFIGSHFTSEPTASPVLTKWWNLELMLAANFGSPYKWLPKLVAKFWLPNSVLYQTDIGAKNLTHKGNFSHKPESTDNMPVNQVSESGIKFFFRKWPKTSKIPYFGLIRGQKGAKKLAHKTHFSQTWNYPQHACKPSFMGAHWKLSEKIAKNLQNFQFWLIFCN